jgi:hypothetical protein
MAAVMFVLLLFVPYLGWPAEYDWSKVRKGGKDVNNTHATGTNDAGWIVGYWEDRSEVPESQAFRFQKNKFTPFTIPGVPEAVRVQPEDIASSSTIVGIYFRPFDPSDLYAGTWHAFLYRHGLNDHILLDVPGAIATYPFAVNDKRQVALGYWVIVAFGELA